MKREKIIKLMPIMQAFAEGKTIQFKRPDETTWYTTYDPHFTEFFEWRIKPETNAIYYDDKNDKCYQEKPMDGTEFYTFIRKDYVEKLMNKLKIVCGNSAMRFIEKELQELREI